MKRELNVKWVDDFWETSEALLQDVILLEAMALRLEREESCMLQTTAELREDTCMRLLNYLSQHADELFVLQRRLKNI